MLFVAISLCSAFFSVAQKDTASFEKKIVGEFCEGFEKIASRVTKDNMDMEIGMLFLPLLSKYEKEIKKEWNLDATDAKDLAAIGTKLGELSAVRCEPFRDFVMNNIDAINKGKDTDATFEAKGTLAKIEGLPFVYMLVQNKAGKTDKIYWLEFFDGAQELSVNASSYLNKTVTVSYKEMEVYDNQNKEYKKIKIATGIKK
jgi:hypothetical protein